MSLVLLFFGAGTPPSPDNIDDIYTTDLSHWWYETYASGTWTDIADSCDVTQATSTRRPTQTVTPGGKVALSFDVIASEQDSLSSSTAASFPGSTCSAQFGFAFYAPRTPTGSFAAIYKSTSSGWVQFYWSINYNVSCFGSGTGSLDAYILPGEWNTVIIDVRGGADASTNGFNVYINGVKAYAHSGATTQDPATKFALSQDDFFFGSNSNDLPGVILCSPYAAYRTSDFTLDTTAQSAAGVLKRYIGGFLTERPPPVWFPSASDVRRPRYLEAYQQSFVYDFIAANPPLTPVALTEHPTVPQRPTPRTTFQAFGMAPQPERASPLAAVEHPASVLRPSLAPAQQVANAPRPEQQIVALDIVFPEAVRRPVFPATAQLFVTEISPQPERKVAATDVSWPDFVRRPFFNVSLQLAATEISPKPERTSPLADVFFPEAVRRPFYVASTQPFITSISPQPERQSPLTDVSWPDFVKKPYLAAANQFAVTEISPQPERIAPLTDVRWPDRPTRALPGTWTTQAFIDPVYPIVANPAPIEGYAEFPAFVLRPKFDAARQHAATTEPSTPPATVVAPTQGYALFPDWVYRPRYPASEQLAVTELYPQPERQAPLADVEWADFVKKSFLSTASQLAASEEPPQPERQAPLADVEWPAPRRPLYAASQQHAYSGATFAPTPYLNATGLTVHPDSVFRPKYGAGEQQAYADPTATTFLAQFIQRVSIGWHPDAVYRPTFVASQQQAFVEPRRERTAPLEWAECPAFVLRPKVIAAHQPFVSSANVRPERTFVAFDVSFPDFSRRPFFATVEQLPFVEPRLERAAPGIEPSYPDFACRPFFVVANQLAITGLSPAPERKAPLAASIFPDAVYRPKYPAANQLYYAGPDPELARARQPVTQFPVGFPDFARRPFYPVTEQPYASSGIAVFLSAFAPEGKAFTANIANNAASASSPSGGGTSFAINRSNVRISIANDSVRVTSTGSKVRE